MTFRHSLSWVGRGTRRKCAQTLALELQAKIDAWGPGDEASAMVTSKKQLDAFRDRRLGRSQAQLLHHLKLRIQAELAPCPVLVALDYKAIGDRLYHLTATVTPSSVAR